MSVKSIIPVHENRFLCVWLVVVALSCCFGNSNILAASTEGRIAAGIAELPLGSAVPYPGALAISADGRTAAHISTNGEIVLWEPDTFRPVERIPPGTRKPSAIAMNASGELVAIGYQDSLVVVWSRRTHKVEREFKGNWGFVYAVAFSSDGRKLAGGSIEGSVQVWEVQSGTRLHSFDSRTGAPEGNSGASFLGVGFSADGHVLVANEWYTGQYEVARGVAVWDIEKGIDVISRSVAPPNTDNHPRVGAVLGDYGRALVYTGNDGLMVQRLDNCGELPRKMSFGGYADTVAADWQGRWIAAAEPYKLTFSDMQTGGSVHSLDLPKMTSVLLPHPDGRSVFAVLINMDSARNVQDGEIYRITVPRALKQMPTAGDSRGGKGCRTSPASKVLQGF